MFSYQILTEVMTSQTVALTELLAQLSSSASPLEVNKVNKSIKQGDLVIFIALDDQRIVAMLSLAFLTVPTGLRARIEDVVVDQGYRRKGIGRQLTRLAIQYFRNSGAKTLDLTSSPGRAEANRLYQSEGFKLRQTNVYRLDDH